MSTQLELQPEQPQQQLRPYSGKRPLTTCIACGKPGAIRYINKIGQITYEHRTEPPIKVDNYRGHLLYRYRRCSGGYRGQSVEDMIEHGVQTKKQQQIMQDIARTKQKIDDGKTNKNKKYVRKQQILCPRCGKSGSVTIRGEQLTIDHYGGRHVSHNMITPEQKQKFMASIETQIPKEITKTKTKRTTKPVPRIKCPKCHEEGRASARKDGRYFVDHYFPKEDGSGVKHTACCMITPEQKEKFRESVVAATATGISANVAQTQQIVSTIPTPTPTPKRRPGRPKKFSKFRSSYQRKKDMIKELRMENKELRRQLIEKDKIIRSVKEQVSKS